MPTYLFFAYSRLASMETTIGNSNPELWPNVKENGTLFYYVRLQVANWLAKNGKESTDTFSLYNSGTYNNEWMVVDFKELDANSETGLATNLNIFCRNFRFSKKLMGGTRTPDE